MRGSGGYSPDFKQRRRPLVEELGGDALAVRAANALLEQMDIASLDDLWARYDRQGPVVFGYEIRDLRHVGPLIHERIIERVMAREPGR